MSTFTVKQIQEISEALIKKTLEGKLEWASAPLNWNNEEDEGIWVVVDGTKISIRHNQIDSYHDTYIIKIDDNIYPFGKKNRNRIMHALEYRRKLKTELLESILKL